MSRNKNRSKARDRAGETGVVLDANVIVDAITGWLIPSYATDTEKISAHVLSSVFCTSHVRTTVPVWDEVYCVLSRPSGRIATPVPAWERLAFLGKLGTLFTFVRPGDLIRPCCDRDDNKILQAAASTDGGISPAFFILSWDQHLLRMGQVGATQIYSPSRYAEQVMGIGRETLLRMPLVDPWGRDVSLLPSKGLESAWHHVTARGRNAHQQESAYEQNSFRFSGAPKESFATQGRGKKSKNRLMSYC